MAAMVHELVGWSSASEQCDLHRFIEKYGRYVPLLVRIADGYAGRDESMHLFAQNEVYWVNDILKQPRVIATDREENYISIPLDYKQRFHIIERGQKSSARPLRDIIERVKKRDVDFMVEGNNQVSFSLGADLGDKKELGLLRFDMMYDLKYLLAFPILDNYLQPKLSAIPAYMPVTLDVAVGFKYGTDADFQRFGKELQNAVQRFDKLPLTLCNDILLSEEAPESDYEYVNPVHVVLIDDDKDEVFSSPFSSPPLSCNTDNNCTSGNSASRSKQANNAPARCAPAGGSSSSHVKSKPISLPPMPTMKQTTATTSAVKRRGPPVPPRKSPSANDCDGIRRHLDRSLIVDCDDDDDCTSEPTVLRDGEHGRGPGSHRRRRRRANSVDSLLNFQPAFTLSSDSESEIGSRSRTHPPPPPPGRSDRSNSSSTSSKFRGDLGIVPANIASLSVEEVGECLHLLHLDEYVDQFHRMDVDGQLLVSLSVQVLTSDFNFSVFEAIKLMKFAVEGWRPLKRSTSPD